MTQDPSRSVYQNTPLTMADIKHFFEEGADPPLKDGEFKEFWLSLDKEERDEFRNTPLT